VRPVRTRGLGARDDLGGGLSILTRQLDCALHEPAVQPAALAEIRTHAALQAKVLAAADVHTTSAVLGGRGGATAASDLRACAVCSARSSGEQNSATYHHHTALISGRRRCALGRCAHAILPGQLPAASLL
jgi:hypothetical protein